MIIRIYKLYQQTNRVIDFADIVEEDYITKICNDKKNRIAYHSIGNTKKDTISTIFIYRKYTDKVYLLLMAVHPSMRSYGYGAIAMNEFIEYMECPIILHSLASSASFYEKCGFKQIKKNRFLDLYEGQENKIIYKIDK
jgi:N-acetylglutamate synthase-like GNAT family acetyltransferase